MSKFIELTSNVDQKPVMINTDHIVSMMPSADGGTTLKLSTQQHFYVEEDADTIKQMLKAK